MNLLSSKRNLLALGALLAGVLLVLYFMPQSRLGPARDALTEVQTIETLRAQFNHDNGKIRLILLLSPT